jgi:antitoxin component of MazEF toxin-antitoxin module
MRIRLVRIGKSRGILIPQSLLDQLGCEDDVDLTVHSGRLVIIPIESARRGWGKSFATMAACGDDRLVHGEQLTASAWDEEAWEW